MKASGQEESHNHERSPPTHGVPDPARRLALPMREQLADLLEEKSPEGACEECPEGDQKPLVFREIAFCDACVAMHEITGGDAHNVRSRIDRCAENGPQDRPVKAADIPGIVFWRSHPQPESRQERGTEQR